MGVDVQIKENAALGCKAIVLNFSQKRINSNYYFSAF